LIDLRPVRLLWIAALALLALPSCSKKIVSTPLENQRPFVEFSRAPSRSEDVYSYSYEMFWRGFDPDGELREFQYAVDPPAPTPLQPVPDTAWISTSRTRVTLQFQATSPEPPVQGTEPIATSYHVLVLRAVDDRGLSSEPQVVAFNAFTVAPWVRITNPVPSSRGRTVLPPSLRITWEGNDPDGISSTLPTHYRVKLLTPSTPITPAMIVANRDTLINYYRPRNWATWDSLPGDATDFSLSLLSPDQAYAFAVIAFDEAGAYTPYADRNSNVLSFTAGYAQLSGPTLTMYNEFFSYTYSNGIYAPNDPRFEVNLEVPSGVPLTVHWSAEPVDGTDVRWFRWVVDPEDFDDNRQRTNERTDITHWSQPSLFITSADLPPYTSAGVHRLYIEVGDGNGLKSLGVVRFQVVVANFDRPLAIMDDTRLTLDRRSPGTTTCIDRPIGPFPMAAELDTFLYARGGFPMKCFPAGYYSRAGIFRGYDFDTLTTRLGRANPSPTLSLLSRYYRVLWLVDPDASESSTAGNSLVNGITGLRYMNTVGNFNALAAYVRSGGELWMAGGGAASASVISYNVGANDRPLRTYAAAAGEIRPSRFTYDMMHWRSEIRTSSGDAQILRSLGRLANTPGAYSLFPASLNPRHISAGDSMPPWRTSTGEFNRSTVEIEALTLPNRIIEDVDPGEDVEMASVMDTIFSITAGTIPAGAVGMTSYHGSENGRVIVSGFDLWSFRRAQLVQLVDAVLQGLWGMQRRP